MDLDVEQTYFALYNHSPFSIGTVDDPLDAVAVHMGGGLWGLISVALFQDGGIVFGGDPMILAWNMVGALAIIGWSGGICVIMFGIMRLSGLLRVPPELEMQGESLGLGGKGWGRNLC